MAYLAAHHSVSGACDLITTLGGLLTDGHSPHPQQLLDRARQPGRSMGPWRAPWKTSFVERHLALSTDHAARLAAGRHQRRIAETPEPPRPAMAAFEAALLQARQRSHRARTRPRADSTLDNVLSTVRASGNIATEELVHLLEQSGLDTGLDLDRVVDAVAVVERAVGHELPSNLCRAGGRARV